MNAKKIVGRVPLADTRFGFTERRVKPALLFATFNYGWDSLHPSAQGNRPPFDQSLGSTPTMVQLYEGIEFARRPFDVERLYVDPCVPRK